jgi:agmatinase
MDEFEKLLIPTIDGRTPTFLGVPLAKSKEELRAADAAIVGIPFLRLPPIGRKMQPSVLDVYNLRRASLKYGGYLPELDLDIFEHVKLVDCGNIEVIQENIERSIELTVKEISRIVKAGCIPITIGTPPSGCYPIAKAMIDEISDVGIVHLDAHCDNLEMHAGNKWSGACWVARTSELNFDMKNFFQLGIRGPRVFKEQIDWHKKKGVSFFTIRDIRERGLEEILKEILSRLSAKKILLAIDFDVLDLGAGPGLDEPAGISTWELLKISYEIGKGGLGGFCVEWIPSSNTPLYWIVTWTILYALAGVAKRKIEKVT